MRTAAHAQIAYCEEQVECRRSLLLAHFGEAWDPARCQRTCDVCAQRGQHAFQQVGGNRRALLPASSCNTASLHENLSGHALSRHEASRGTRDS